MTEKNRKKFFLNVSGRHASLITRPDVHLRA
jgi:hypothetical protein